MGKATQQDGASSGRRTTKGKKATPAQKSAGMANLAKGRAARDRKRAEAAALNLPTAHEKWGMLLDGRITVADLDIEELRAMRVRGKDGVINNGKRVIPSHIAHAMRNEFIQRAMTNMEDALPELVDALVEIGLDPEAMESSRVKAIGMVMERIMGRTAQEVHVSGSGFDDVVGGVVRGIVVDRVDLED